MKTTHKRFDLDAERIRASESKNSAGKRVEFPNEDYLEALLSGWPWTVPSLILPNDERVFWVRRGSAGADLIGVTSSGKPIAVEVKMAPWANGIDKPIRQIVRGLARFWKQKTDTTVFSTPFGVALDLAKEPIGILAFDGSFVKDFSKEAERFGERFEQVLKDPSSENNWKGNESKARDWLSGESRRVHLFAAALDKSSGPDGLVVESKVWDFGVLPRTK